MDLKNVRPSKNLEDRTGPDTNLQAAHKFMFRLLYPQAAAANDLYVERANNAKGSFLRYKDKTIKDWSPEEWSKMRENGFSPDDIQVMRDFYKKYGKPPPRPE